MAPRFITDPYAMRDMASRFEMHTQTVEGEAFKMWASLLSIADSGWSSTSQALPTTLWSR